ncbi:hypothetical protein [Vreelandella salicampi]|uniref:Uncharacterized protein n=1 Tax=Vreelandella salicampi TaxID=1449798 RepID=A0A7Z0LN48_9GAMM|nr:hypothetical protein [Halomonas salicampi]NYS61996.1 hypothetical protein [Halomonas salicampi]
MKTTKRESNSFDNVNSTSFDAEVLAFWGERARFQLSYMDANAAYLE